MRLAGIGLAVVLVLAAAAPAPAQRPTREQALAALGNGADTDARRRGAQWLGVVGTFADLPRLVQALRDDDQVVRALAEQAMWELWSRSGDDEVDQLLAVGIEQMNARQAELAVETFSRVIARKPDFAEGWNKRATLYYLMGEYQRSLADCDEVMRRNPYHFGALSGYGLIYLQLDQADRALEYFERALAVNPNLNQVRATVDMLRARLLRQRRQTI